MRTAQVTECSKSLHISLDKTRVYEYRDECVRCYTRLGSRHVPLVDEVDLRPISRPSLNDPAADIIRPWYIPRCPQVALASLPNGGGSSSSSSSSSREVFDAGDVQCCTQASSRCSIIVNGAMIKTTDVTYKTDIL